MTDHVWGVDKSHFDSPTGTAGIVSEGFGFLTHKAGGDANDGELNTWWNDAKGHRADILLGAYWVLYPGHGAGAADTFLARIDSQCPGWRDGPFILQLDCEKWNGDSSTVPGLGDIRAMCNRLRVLAPKLMPIVYAPKWVYGNSLAGLGYPIWSSSYVSGSGSASAIYPGDSYSGWTAYSGIVPTIAQFSSTATVNGDSTSDVNAFKGTIDQLTALLAPGWVEDMALTGADGQTVWNTDTIPNPDQRVDSPGHTPAGTNENTQAWYALGDLWQLTYNLRDAVAGLATQLSQVKALVATPPQVDTAALAAALGPEITGLEPGELLLALEAAFRSIGGAPAALTADLTVTQHVQGDQAASTTGLPVYDAADAATRAAREARQPDIQGS